MPKRTWLNRTLAAALRATPALEVAALRLGDAWYRCALLPFRRRRIAGRTADEAGLVSRTDALNAAAERYFAEADANYLLNKPYSDRENLPRHLVNAGTLIEALRLLPGDTVLELGAGSCWLSHMLNLHGCRTISVDVSATALTIGRRLFDRDPRTDWSLEPRFETYDGHRLPVATASVDRVTVNDAFHHVPNQREILEELCRVLAPDGLVVMSEPGRGHSTTADSAREVARAGVLENELVVEDLVALARCCGFVSGSVLVASAGAPYEIDAADLGAFMGGKGFTAYWKALCGALERHHYIVLSKARETTTRHPRRLSARIEVDAGETLRATAPGASRPLSIRVSNTGDTTWLHAPERGWTRLGAHLYRNDAESARLLDHDWLRAGLPVDVRPGDTVNIAADLPPIHEPGSYTIVFDLVVEGLLWFADRGSEPARAHLSIGPGAAGLVVRH